MPGLESISEEKRSFNDQVTESDLKLKSEILNSINDSIVLREFHEGVAGRVVYANEAAYRLRGYTHDEFIGMRLEDYITEDSQKKLQFNLDRLSQNGETTWKGVTVRKDGSRFPVEIHSRIIHLGQQSYMLSVLRDITDRKYVQLSLLATKEKLDKILEELPVGFVIASEKWQALTYNRLFVKMCGYKTREEFATVSVLDYFKDSVDRENFLKRIARRPIKNFEAKINKKDGTSFWASISSFLYLNTSREKYYYLIIHDVNQRKEDIEELRLRAQILDATSDAIYLRQVNGPIVYMNGATEKIFGYTMDELNAIGLPQIITQDNKPLYKPRLKEIIEKGHAKFETVIERKDKSLYPVETTARLIKFKDENYILAISRDVSERKKNEAQNQTYNTKLQSLASDVFLAEEKERRRIATEVHDRTGQMLALCRIRLKNILEENLPQPVSDPLYEILSNIEKTIGEMRSLVFDLSSPLLYELGLEAALEQLLEEFESKFHIKCSLHAGNKPVALSEEVRVLLFQATRELVTNVIKHAKANNIDVNVRKRTDKVFVNVRDDGIGFKVDNSNNGTAKNEGFGIFSIRERLHYIGGNMRIISKQGRGTNVTISVPAV